MSGAFILLTSQDMSTQSAFVDSLGLRPDWVRTCTHTAAKAKSVVYLNAREDGSHSGWRVSILPIWPNATREAPLQQQIWGILHHWPACVVATAELEQVGGFNA